MRAQNPSGHLEWDAAWEPRQLNALLARDLQMDGAVIRPATESSKAAEPAIASYESFPEKGVEVQRRPNRPEITT